MRVFPPNNSSYATAVTRSGPPPLLREPEIQLTVEEISRMRLVIKLVILVEHTRRLLRLVIKLVILAERTRRTATWPLPPVHDRADASRAHSRVTLEALGNRSLREQFRRRT